MSTSLEGFRLPEHIVTAEMIVGISTEIPPATEVLIPWAIPGTWNNGSPTLINDNTFVVPPDAQGKSESFVEIQSTSDSNATVTMTIKLVVQGMTILSFPIPSTAAGVQRDLLHVFQSKATTITRPFSFELQNWVTTDSGGPVEVTALNGRASYELRG